MSLAPGMTAGPLALSVLLGTQAMAAAGWIALRARDRTRLRAERHLYRDIFAGTTEGVAIADAESGAVLHVSATFDALVGGTAGRTIADLFDLPPGMPLAPEALAGLRALSHASGDAVRVDVNVAGVRYGGRDAVALVLRDASDRAAIEHDLRETRDQAIQARALAEEAREHAEEMLGMKSAFLANLSHELQTPLAEIIGYVDVLHDEAPEALALPIDSIRSGAERLRQTILALLELSDLEAGRLPVEHGTVDVSALAAQVVEDYRDRAESAGLPLLFAAPSPAPALADRGHLSRALSYVLDNALKFTDAGRVAVVVAASGGEVEVAVRDSGIGMSEADIGRAFAPFSQLSSGDARTHEGSGLGLSLARSLISEMGGALLVESQEGEGTLVRIRLARSPLPEPAEALATMTLAPDDPAPTRSAPLPVFAPPSGDGAPPDYVIRPIIEDVA